MLVQNADATDAAHQDVVAAVTEQSVLFDDARATDVEHGWAPGVARLEAGLQPRDGQRSFAGERVAHEISVTGLEDVKRQRGPRKQSDVRQRKYRQRSEVSCVEHQWASGCHEVFALV